MKGWTYEEVKEYIESFGYELLSTEYKNNKTKLLVQCDKGHEYEVTFGNFKNSNSRCPYCEKHTYEEVKEYIEGFGYKLLSTEYINNKNKLLLQCPNGHKWKTKYNDFQQGHRCSYCNGNPRYTYEEIKEYIEQFDYKLLSDEYKNNKSKLLIKCDKNHEFMMRFNNFVNGNRCPYCYGNTKYTYEEVKEYIESFGYKLLSDEYKNNKNKLLIKCPNGHIWEIKYNSFQQGHRCPICNVSKGEQRIIDWLEKNNIEYLYEKTFDNLLGIGNGLLSYDFYLPKYNLLIEYQGEQHEHEVKGFGDFEIQQEHDKRKREYVEKNRYRLLEIWYWDFENIEKILMDTLEEE